MTRRRELLKRVTGGGGGHDLPSEYQEVEWVQFENDSSVYSFVNTMRAENTVAFVSVKAKRITSAENNYCAIVGVATQNINHSCVIKANDTWEVNGWTIVDDTSTSDFNEGVFAVGTWGNNLIFGAGTTNLNKWTNANNRIYYLKFLNSNEESIAEYYPCYRISDNVIGYYDKINEVFLTKTGTGTLTKGDDV